MSCVFVVMPVDIAHTSVSLYNIISSLILARLRMRGIAAPARTPSNNRIDVRAQCLRPINGRVNKQNDEHTKTFTKAPSIPPRY